VKTERIDSGVPGLDKLIEGGFVKGSANLLAGQTGTGKTIFCCQYILHGLRKGEPAVYLTLEQQEAEIMADVARFGWDKEFKQAIDQKKFLLLSEFPSSVEQVKTAAFNAIRRVGAKRFVLDSLSIASMGWQEGTNVSKIRREVFDLMRTLKKTGVTSVLVTEIPEEAEKQLSRFGFEEFLADGVVILYFSGIGGIENTMIRIRKMRRTAHEHSYFPLKFGRNGLSVGRESLVAIK